MPSVTQRALVALTATVVTVSLLAVLYWARSIFIPVALAIFLAFVLGPVVAWLQRRRLGRTPSVVVVVALVVLTAVGIGAVVTQQMASLADTLPDRRDAIKAKLTEAKQRVVGDGDGRFGGLIDDVAEAIGTRRTAPDGAMIVQPAEPSWTTRLQAYVDPATEVLGQAAFTFILTVFMLVRKEDLRNRVIRLLGSGKVTTTTKAVDDASRRISRYLFAQLVLNSAFGAIVTLVLLAMGVRYALLWGFVATVMRYVPYIGTWIGLIPPVLFSFAMSEGLGQPVAVLVLFVALELLCNNVFEPWLYGRSMGLSEVAQLVAAGIWTFLWGPVGLILSGPLTVCLFVLGRHVRQFDFFVVLLGDQPALEPQVAFYQRLTARDQDEASTVALAEAKANGPDAVFDSIIVPAMCLARRDHDDGDLDAADVRFIVRAAREVAEEVNELREPWMGAEQRVRVLLCPARDEAEHVAADLLALSLDPNRWEVKVAGDETLASELIDIVTEFQPAIVVLVTLPPGGVSHTRYLRTRLLRQFPEVKLLIGRWGCGEETPGNASDGVDRSIAATRKRLSDLYPLLTAEGAVAGKSPPERDLIGTASA
jgi:predicted PurR-regulated permease PerM